MARSRGKGAIRAVVDGQPQLRGEGSAAIEMASQLGGTLKPPGTDKSSTKNGATTTVWQDCPTPAMANLTRNCNKCM